MKNVLFVSMVIALLSVSVVVAQTPIAELEYDPTVCWDGNDKSDACYAMMQAFPKPDFENISPDSMTLDTYSFWQVGPDPVNLFDAPAGNVIGQIPAGYNFINAIDLSVDGWIQRVGGEWVERSGARYAEASYYTGVLVSEDWQYPFVEILDRTGIYTSLNPGEEGSAESGYVTRRYDVFNIFAEATDSAGDLWYLIGPDRWIRQEFVSKFQPIEKPEDVIADRWVAVDLFEQTITAYEDETPVFTTLISSGVAEWSTNEGTFDIWARLARDAMSGATGAPEAYALQDVPWTMYFDGGISLHGTYWHDDFGYRHSHGCVNLSISDARWVFEWTDETEPDEDGNILNQVYVFSSQEYEDET